MITSTTAARSQGSGSAPATRWFWALGVILLTLLLAYQLARPAAMLWEERLAPLFAADWVSEG